MEPPEKSISVGSQPGSGQPDDLSLSALGEAYRTLRIQFLAVLLMLAVLCGSLNIYLLRQVTLVRRELKANRPVVDQIVAEYVRSGGPVIKDFLTKLEVFSKTHPDFRPILAKYVNATNSTAAPVPSKNTPGK
jgi:hypothetical protein